MKASATSSTFDENTYGRQASAPFFAMQSKGDHLGIQFILDKAMFVHLNP
jgi:hypothetical protein